MSIFSLRRKSFEPEFPAMHLTGSRIMLRPPHKNDCSAWIELRRDSREHLVPFEPQWHEKHLTRAYFEHRITTQARAWDLGLSCSFLIFKKEDGQMIGGANLNNICRGSAQFSSLGYWLGRGYLGQGYMSESLRLLLSYAFDEQELNRVNAATLPHNGRSMKLLRRLGFEEEGFAKSWLEINGEWQDHILFGLTRKSFERRSGILA